MWTLVNDDVLLVINYNWCTILILGKTVGYIGTLCTIFARFYKSISILK